MIIDRYGESSTLLSRVIRTEGTLDGKVQLLIEGGESLVVSDGAWANALRSTVQCMTPAEPGTFAVGLYVEDDSDEAKMWKRRVLAWAVSYEGNVLPITINGVNDGGDDETDILYSDGRVETYDGSWANLDAWQRDRAARIGAKVRGPIFSIF